MEAQVEAASPRPPSWAVGHTELSAGVLGETALPEFCGLSDLWPNRRIKDDAPYRWTVLNIQRRRAGDSPLPRLRDVRIAHAKVAKDAKEFQM